MFVLVILDVLLYFISNIYSFCLCLIIISAEVSPDLSPGLLEITLIPGVLEKTSQTTCSANTPLVYSCFALKESSILV